MTILHFLSLDKFTIIPASLFYFLIYAKVITFIFKQLYKCNFIECASRLKKVIGNSKMSDYARFFIHFFLHIINSCVPS